MQYFTSLCRLFSILEWKEKRVEIYDIESTHEKGKLRSPQNCFENRHWYNTMYNITRASNALYIVIALVLKRRPETRLVKTGVSSWKPHMLHTLSETSFAMKLKDPQFMVKIDDSGQNYSVANATAVKRFKKGQIQKSLRVFDEGTKDACSFLDSKLSLSHKQSDIYSTDLTSRDDLILAIFSLTLILVIESILAAILLRTVNGNVSNFGFSVKQFVDLGRGFEFRHLIKGKKAPKPHPNAKRVNVKLLTIASLILVSTFGLESALLFLSNPHFRRVTNRTATFTFLPTIYPDWNSVRRAANSIVDRPCRDVTFEGKGINMGATRLVSCVTSSATGTSFKQFETTDEVVFVEMISDVHRYGADHYVSIGTQSAKYSARAYMAHGGSSIMKNGAQNSGKQFFFMHRQLVAYLYNIYVIQTGDKRMNLERLQKIKFKEEGGAGPQKYVIMSNGNAVGRAATTAHWTLSNRHKTTFNATVPTGLAALRFAAIFFRASHGVSVTGPNMWILSTTKGREIEKEVLLWEEEARSVNWLSLLLMLLIGMAVLAILHSLLKPVGMIEIVNTFIQETQEEYTLAANGKKSGTGTEGSGYSSSRDDEYESAGSHRTSDASQENLRKR